MKRNKPESHIQTNLRPGRSRGENDSGVALFMVLWVLVLLSVIVTEFCYSMRSEVNITRNLKEKTVTYYIALAGIHTAIQELVRENGFPLRREEDEPANAEEEVVWCINADIPAFPYGDGFFKVWIDNESGQFDLNAVEKQTLLKLLSGFDIDDFERDVIADSILDWRDSNTLHRVNGAEDDYYESLPEPYSCKDADFESVAELLLVRGVTPALYDGGLGSIFTVYESGGNSPLEKTKTKPRGRINLNAASRATLTALPDMPEDVVSSIMEYRTVNDFHSSSDVIRLLGADMYASIASFVDFSKTEYYTIHSVGSLNDSRVEHYMKVLIALDPASERKYRVIKWWDQASS